MPRLSDEDMAKIRATLEQRRAAKRAKNTMRADHPLKIEVMANVTHYEVRGLVSGSGTETLDQDGDLAALQGRWLKARLAKSRAMFYAVGRLPSRGADAVGSWPIASEDLYD